MERTIEIAPVKPEIYYPESDGEPMGETDFHISVILYLRQGLRHFFRQAEQVYVAADMCFYYEEGNPTAYKVPDVFVVKGVSKHDRRIYKVWEEQATPCTMFEITSKSTRLEDLGTKKALYEMLEVKEYFLFDPLDEYLSPRLQGFRLVGNYYQPLPLLPDGTLESQELGAILRPDGNMLRIVDPTGNQTVPTLDEAVELAMAELERAESEAKRAVTAEAEVTQLRAEVERLRHRFGQS